MLSEQQLGRPRGSGRRPPADPALRERLHAYRMRNNLTLRLMAELVGTSYTTIFNIEHGYRVYDRTQHAVRTFLEAHGG